MKECSLLCSLDMVEEKRNREEGLLKGHEILKAE